MNNIIVIYHGNCADGFGAAWAARKYFGETADYYAATHQDPPPDVTDKHVVLVDFSYKRPVLQAMAASARSILVLDHHKSAEEDLVGGNGVVRIDDWDLSGRAIGNWDAVQLCVEANEEHGEKDIYAFFDMNRSGAGIAWDFFNTGVDRPPLINHIEDRDLWRFVLPGTREIQANVFSYPYDFAVWDSLMSMDPEILELQGTAIERKHHKDIAELVKVCKRRMTIDGTVVWVASLPYTLTSDAGHLMAEGEQYAACYWDTAEGRVFSLRSTDAGADVSEVAKQYGGGGHRNAAGFRVPRDHELARA